MYGHHRPASETPFKRRFAGGPMMPTFSGIWIPSLIKKKLCQSWTPLTKLSGSATCNTDQGQFHIIKQYLYLWRFVCFQGDHSCFQQPLSEIPLRIDFWQVMFSVGKWIYLSILLPRPLSNDHRFIQYIYRNNHASKRFVEVYLFTCVTSCFVFCITGVYNTRNIV